MNHAWSYWQARAYGNSGKATVGDALPESRRKQPVESWNSWLKWIIAARFAKLAAASVIILVLVVVQLLTKQSVPDWAGARTVAVNQQLGMHDNISNVVEVSARLFEAVGITDRMHIWAIGATGCCQRH